MAGELNWLDRVIGYVSPGSAVRRAQARNALAYYEAARPSRHRKSQSDRSSGDRLVSASAANLRATARHLDRNHDLARGILNVLVRNVVGPQGIGIEPTPRNADDTINDDFARALLNLYHEWCESPEVTGTRDMAMAQQALCRHWLRDGETFTQLISGPVPGLVYSTRMPMALELIEADFCPLHDEDEAASIRQGIVVNAWRQPRAYVLYKDHPGDGRALSEATKQVAAENILHLAVRDRLTQLRGISLFASIITRLDDLKDYEESERIAARIAASMAAYVKKGQPQDYTPETGPDGNPAPARLLDIRPGMIFDDLRPGEEVGTISSDRPNSGLVGFRDGQLRAIAAGVDASNSSISRNYNGSYSAQRQELVEQVASYQILSNQFVAQWLRPLWRRFVQTAVLSGRIRPPAGVRPETWAQAEFLPPVMPWIDPSKEINAIEKAAQTGLTPLTVSIRQRNGSLQKTLEMFKRERDLAHELGLNFTSDPANSAAPTPAAPAAAPAPQGAVDPPPPDDPAADPEPAPTGTEP